MGFCPAVCLYCYQVFSTYFPKSSRKTRHILERCPDLFKAAQEVIVDRPGWISQKSEPPEMQVLTSHENALPALRRSMVVRMLTKPKTTSDDGHISGKVSGRYSYIGPTFLSLSERRMAVPIGLGLTLAPTQLDSGCALHFDKKIWTRLKTEDPSNPMAIANSMYGRPHLAAPNFETQSSTNYCPNMSKLTLDTPPFNLPF